MDTIALLVIAKEPLAGRVKTRLTPPLRADQAARLAEAALRDTLEVVSEVPCSRKVLVFDGDPDRWIRGEFETIPQRGDDLAARLTAAFADVDGPAVLVGMDTPQLTPLLLRRAIAALARPEVDAVLGPADDGGYWTVGLKRPAPAAFTGVPMSSPQTWLMQRARLRRLGLRVAEQPALRDVDTIEDAHAVARLAPQSRFARALRAIAA